DICLVDVRSLEEYEQCHIDGAKHIPLHLLTVRHEEIGDDKPVYIICLSGARSAQAAQWLTPQRTQPMINVAGGMSAWLQMGYPVAD
ncbi:MAG: rhodanese-like domain-containing protein, partial [Ghiorsea sp.]|nr:rhodanese-like domain-containing protein [Ghiorsea sp.]